MTPSEALNRHRASVRCIVEAHKARNPRVFGSVARGQDTDRSDLDLLIDTTSQTSLFDIADLELELEKLLGVQVHVTTDGSLRGPIRDRIFAEAHQV
ncbi:MAG TPA: nucleotidyltransferase domain-containing protein [Rhodopila sp.]|nr:nucleotidyltransferase domain-containing protein [Rhodopila sp.]